ncbi:MAG: hypothetical protein HWE22_07115 [Flavobacteriales bacterium]|nr:hypothetical protein [Flavobacteriales bacterium]
MEKSSHSIWSSIERLLLVVNFDQLDTMKDWREAIKNTGLNIHHCQILAVVATKKERIALSDINSVAYISEKDFGLFGRLKNEEAQRVLAERFDTLLVVGEVPKKIEKALSKLNVKMDVSLNSEDGIRTINLKTEETAPKYMLNFVKQTLEKIT